MASLPSRPQSGTTGEVDVGAGAIPYRPDFLDPDGVTVVAGPSIDVMRVYGMFDFAGGHLGNFMMLDGGDVTQAAGTMLDGQEYWPFASADQVPANFIFSPLLAGDESEIRPDAEFTLSGPTADFAHNNTAWPAGVVRTWAIERGVIANDGTGDVVEWQSIDAYLVLHAPDANTRRFTWFGDPAHLENKLLPSGGPLLFTQRPNTPPGNLAALHSVEP